MSNHINNCDLNIDHNIIVIMISAIIQQTYNHDSATICTDNTAYNL